MAFKQKLEGSKAASPVGGEQEWRRPSGGSVPRTPEEVGSGPLAGGEWPRGQQVEGGQGNRGRGLVVLVRTLGLVSI